MGPLLPIAFWGGLVAAAFLLGWHAGASRAYRHGFEDGLESAEGFGDGADTP